MKKIIFFLALLLCAVASFTACMGEQLPPPPNNDGTVRVMVTEGEGIEIIGDNPRDVLPGEDAEFEVRLRSGYVFVGVNFGEYNEAKGKLIVRNVKERTRVRFSTLSLGYDTNEFCDYRFMSSSPKDESSIYSSRDVSLGTEVTVRAGDEGLKFIGWS